MATKKKNAGQFGARSDTLMQAKRGGMARAKKTTSRTTTKQADDKMGTIDNTLI